MPTDQKILKLLTEESVEKFKILQYCNPNTEKYKENPLGKIYSNLKYDAFSVEVFDWPPENDRRISIEFRSFSELIFLCTILLDTDVDEDLDKIIDEIKKSQTATDDEISSFMETLDGSHQSFPCKFMYFLMTLLFKYIIIPIFGDEENFVWGIEFETKLLERNFGHKDRKKIYNEMKVTVTSELLQTAEKHMPYEDGKYYDCAGSTGKVGYVQEAVGIMDVDDFPRCNYILEGQIGTFMGFSLEEFKENIDILTKYLDDKRKSPDTFVVNIFECTDEHVGQFRKTSKKRSKTKKSHQSTRLKKSIASRGSREKKIKKSLKKRVKKSLSLKKALPKTQR
jgi:hypothetical protein